MCGIAGAWSPGREASLRLVEEMLLPMKHRGPDDSGVAVVGGGAAALGHLRLSIIDLSPLGHQPMFSGDRRHAIVFNGEVYNYREIRRDLEAAGHSFVGNSDTEVVLKSCMQWGIEAVNRFRGMFAFALWDEMRRTLHLCRDRFGVKPLYYGSRHDLVTFASELRGLKAAGFCAGAVDPTALADFVRSGYFCAPHSIWSDVKAVPPGCIVSFDDSLSLRVTQYWSLPAVIASGEVGHLRQQLSSITEDELLDRAQSTLREAFGYRMIADVPVGVFLSGGIDSSLVCAELAGQGGDPLKTFTIGFGDSEYDESAHARRVADHLGTEHTAFQVTQAELLGLVEEIVDLADEPIGDNSVIPNLAVARLARPHVKVALSADGADEFFGGYVRYLALERRMNAGGLMRGLRWLSADVLSRLPPELVGSAYRQIRQKGGRYAGVEDKIRKFVRMTKAKDEFGAYHAATSEWDADALREIGIDPDASEVEAAAVWSRFPGIGRLERMMYYDTSRYLPGDLLTKGDRASMYASLEVREPFLDHSIAVFSAALPHQWKIRAGKGKYVLRRLLRRHFPADWFDRPKQGFAAPIGEWMRGPLSAAVRYELSRERVRETGLLDDAVVPRLAESYLANGSGIGTTAVWILFQLQRWAGRWKAQAR